MNIQNKILSILDYRINTSNNELDYYTTQIERDKEYNISMQHIEDKRIERDIRYTAIKMINRYIESPTMEIEGKKYKNCIVIVPFINLYTIYNEDSAVYKDVNINELIMKEYNLLKENYLKWNPL